MNNTPMPVIQAKYNGYCNTCQFSIFRGERIRFNGKAFHLDCLVALVDKLPRRMNPQVKSIYGDVDRKRMRDLISQRGALPRTPATASSR